MRLHCLRDLLPLLTVLTLAACSGAPGTPGSGSVANLPTATSPQEKTLYGIYMVGSNLEDDVMPRNGKPDEAESGSPSKIGAGSYDLQEMVEAWQVLPAGTRSGLDLVVAFGGARKSGWQGVKYADLDCLSEDAQDGLFGNATCYRYSASDQAMSNPAALSHFVSYLQQTYPDHGRKVFQFWNHGLAYLGVGYDTNSKRSHDYITLPEIRESFASTQAKFDLIGFDACLMASLEVAQAIAPYARYMLASEELEPAHGWYYTDLVKSWSQREQSIPAIAQQVIDSYFEHSGHQGEHSQNKTLSLVDLDQVANAVTALDQLVASLNVDNFQPLLTALESSQRFGEEPRNSLDYSIDVLDWLQQLQSSQPTVTAAVATAEAAMQKTVVSARHQATRPDSNGLSIYSLNAKMKNKYGSDQSVSPAWLDFASRFVTRGSNDVESPQLGASLRTQQVDNLCQQGQRQGHCLQVSDNLGLKAVEQIFALQADERYLFQIGSERLSPDPDQPGHYFAPSWDGEWLLLCDGDCKQGLSVFPPAYFSGVSERQTRLYTSEAQINGLDTVFYIEIGQNNAVVSSWAVPYEIGSAGEAILSREIINLKAGDTVRFYFRVNDLQSGELRWQVGQALTFAQTPSWDFARIDGPRRYFVQASDYKGNLTVSDLYQLK